LTLFLHDREDLFLLDGDELFDEIVQGVDLSVAEGHRPVDIQKRLGFTHPFLKCVDSVRHVPFVRRDHGRGKKFLQKVLETENAGIDVSLLQVGLAFIQLLQNGRRYVSVDDVRHIAPFANNEDTSIKMDRSVVCR